MATLHDVAGVTARSSTWGIDLDNPSARAEWTRRLNAKVEEAEELASVGALLADQLRIANEEKARLEVEHCNGFGRASASTAKSKWGRRTAAPAEDAARAASSASATTATFHSLRDSLLRRFGKHGEYSLMCDPVDAFESLARAARERRAVFEGVVNREALRRYFADFDTNHPAVVRAYLDARRGVHEPSGKIGSIFLMPSRLTSDVRYFAHAAGSLYRVPERISAEDLREAISKLEDVDGARELTVEDCEKFIREWDSSDYLHRDGAMHVLDFAVFMRFATMNDDAEGAANVLNATKNLTDRTRANAMLRVAADVRRQTREKLTRYRAAGTRLGRDVARNREADALIEALQEEVAVYVSHRDPAVGDVERELEFRVELVMPVGIAADAAGDAVGSRCRLVPRLTPAPTIALLLHAMDDNLTGYVTPSDVRLALSQCGIPLTATEALVLGEMFEDSRAKHGVGDSTRARWAIDDVLEILDAEPLPPCRGGIPTLLWRWARGARAAVVKYMTSGGAVGDRREKEYELSDVSDAEMTRYLVAPSLFATFEHGAIRKVARASLFRRNKLVKAFRALDDTLPETSGATGVGALTQSNVKYAAMIAGCDSPSFTRDARLETLAERFVPSGPGVPSKLRLKTTGMRGKQERYVDWRGVVRAAGPSFALCEQEKAAGAAVGGVHGVGVDACGISEDVYYAGEDAKRVRADDVAHDGDVVAVLASIASWTYEWIADLRREFESRDAALTGALSPGDFLAAMRAAGFGVECFGESELRWCVVACRHQSEDAVVYPKYLALVLSGIEREVEAAERKHREKVAADAAADAQEQY